MSGTGSEDDEMAMDSFTMDELREFLEADLVGVRADPEFKEKLRRRLWEMVQARARAVRRGQRG